MKRFSFSWMVALAVLVLSGCGDDTTVVADPSSDVANEDELSIEVLHADLAGPTQFVVDGDRFLVAIINGEENGGEGQVISVERGSDERTVLLDGLDKPTGIALLDGDLWVMERDILTRGPIGGDWVVIADELPNNGRSQGTLTVTPGDTLLFNTSGRMRDGEVTDGSGRIFEVDPATNSVTELAEGFKHAYAHTFTGDTLWSVEMSDGTFDGQPAADELVAVAPGADHGWPHCVGDRRVVVDFGGTAQRCSQTPPSQAVFGPSATPTSIVVSPFNDDELLISLWREDRIVAVSTDQSSAPHSLRQVLGELDDPQHLVASRQDGNPVVYLTEFGTGRLLALTAAGR